MRSKLVATVSDKLLTKDVRMLEASEVCGIGQWLHEYMRMELVNPRLTDSEMLLHVLVRGTREYEGDSGVFALEEL